MDQFNTFQTEEKWFSPEVSSLQNETRKKHDYVSLDLSRIWIAGRGKMGKIYSCKTPSDVL